MTTASFGCGGDDDEGTTLLSGAGGSTGAEETTSSGEVPGSSSDTTADSSSASGEPPAEPDYPRPDPVDEAGMCPDGFFGPITFDGGGWLCLPACADDPPICPAARSGDAQAECATNPLSSAAPCGDSTDCMVDGEMCGNIGGGQSGCLLPPSHCILRCDDGQTCPDELTCAAGPGICQYEA